MILHRVAIALLWAFPSVNQEVHTYAPAPEAVSATVDLWVWTEYRLFAENRSNNPNAVTFGNPDGEETCFASVRLLADPVLGYPIANVLHRVPNHTVMLEAYDGVDDFAGPSGITETYYFMEHRTLTVTGWQLEKLKEGAAITTRPAGAYIRWHGNGSFGAWTKHGARIWVRFK